MKTKCLMVSMDEPEKNLVRDIGLAGEVISGEKRLRVDFGATTLWISQEDIEKALHGTHNARLKKQLKEYEHLHELDLAEIFNQRRQIDILMGVKE